MAGGALGATCRFLVDRAMRRRHPGPFPGGTLVVNVVGSLLLGLLAGVGTALPGWVGALLGTGFCGALTTYSTFSHETVRLVTAGRTSAAGRTPAAADCAAAGRVGWSLALLNIAATLAVGLAADALGWYLADLAAADQ